MNPKERVLRGIGRQETDRIPLDFWAMPSVISRLLSDLKLSSEEELLQFLQSDVRAIWGGHYIGLQKVTPDGHPADFWGIYNAGTYAGSVGYRPLMDVQSVDDVYAYDWPNLDDMSYAQDLEDCERYSEYATRGSCWAPIFCQSCDLCGMENMLCWMAGEPEIAQAVLDNVTEVYLGMNKGMFDLVGGKLDICFMGDDYGSQRGMIMHPDLWRRMIKPNLARLYGQAKEYGMVTMHHSCGSIVEIIPDLIEIGVDILDPIQVRATGMQPEALKSAFGSRLAFHGGVDTQQTLPYRKEEDVRAEVRDCIRVLGANGGYILNADQYLMDDVPTSNILAMYDEATGGLCDIGQA